jgi:hypothetical protein
MHCLLTLAIIAAGVVWLDNNAMGRLFPNDFYCAVGAGYTYEVIDVIDVGIRTPQERSASQTCQHTSLWEGWIRRWLAEKSEGE